MVARRWGSVVVVPATSTPGPAWPPGAAGPLDARAPRAAFGPAPTSRTRGTDVALRPLAAIGAWVARGTLGPLAAVGAGAAGGPRGASRPGVALRPGFPRLAPPPGGPRGALRSSNDLPPGRLTSSWQRKWVAVPALRGGECVAPAQDFDE